MNNREAAEMIRDDIRRHHDELSGEYRHALNMAIDALRAQDHEVDIRDVPGMWCDDITFCPEECKTKSCPRNSKNIRDRTVPHSFFMEKPDDCPKGKFERGGENRNGN